MLQRTTRMNLLKEEAQGQKERKEEEKRKDR